MKKYNIDREKILCLIHMLTSLSTKIGYGNNIKKLVAIDIIH